MKKIIPINHFGLFADNQEVARVDTRFIAQSFDKRHQDVLRDVQCLVNSSNGISSAFNQYNFALTSYIDDRSKRQPCYQISRDGFIMLVMAYHGTKANKLKEFYLKLFDEMEEQIKILHSVRNEFLMLTYQLQLIYKNPKTYIYSNECNLINRIVIGMSAKQFRNLHGLPKGTSIRPYLSLRQLKQIDDLQKVDAGLLIALPNYSERKQKLEWYYEINYGTKHLVINDIKLVKQKPVS